MRLWHGGAPGLQVGDWLTPLWDREPDVRVIRGPHQPHYAPSRVYVTRHRWYAELFAHLGSGDVYEVRAHAPRPDADAQGSFWCPYAVVKAVVARGPVALPERAARVPQVAALARLLRG